MDCREKCVGSFFLDQVTAGQRLSLHIGSFHAPQRQDIEQLPHRALGSPQSEQRLADLAAVITVEDFHIDRH
jgi:hypothetical protein